MTLLLEWTDDVMQVGSLLTIPSGQALRSHSTIVCGEGGRIQIPDPDERYEGLDITGLDVAVDPLIVGTGAGGPGANAVLRDTYVQRAAPGSAAIRLLNAQNTPLYNTVVRNNDGADGLVDDCGSKNIELVWAHLSSCRYGLVGDTSAGTQRTSKLKWRGGLSENCLASALLLDIEDVLFDGVTFNWMAGSGPTAVVCGTSSTRTGKPVGPSRVGFRNCIFKGWQNAISATKLVEVRDLGGNVGLTTQFAAGRLIKATDADWST